MGKHKIHISDNDMKKKARASKVYKFTYSMVQDIFFQKLIVTQLVKQKPVFFMDPEESSLCSQKPATGTYPNLAESGSPHRSLYL
jgi:hypothetical protein